MLALAEFPSPSGAQELPPGFGRGGVQILRHRVPERHAHEANLGMALRRHGSGHETQGRPSSLGAKDWNDEPGRPIIWDWNEYQLIMMDQLGLTNVQLKK